MNNAPHDVDIDANTTMASIKRAIANINATMRCCDVLFVYLNGHGGLLCQITWTNWVTGAVSYENKTENCPEVGDGIFTEATAVNMDTYITLNGEYIWGSGLA